MLPVGPAGDQVGVGEQHPGRIGVGAENPDRLAGLDEKGFLIAQLTQRGHDLAIGPPVAGGLADAAVDHQVLRPLGHLGIEVVHQHAQRGFGQPAAAGEVGPARRSDCPWIGHGYEGRTRPPACPDGVTPAKTPQFSVSLLARFG